jgi:serine/threonine-protein kinase
MNQDPTQLELTVPAWLAETDAGGEVARRLPADPRYAVTDEVGEGGMGTVVAARDQDLLREVAMKVLKKRDKKGELLRRFVHEAQVTGQLDHPAVPPVYDLGLDAKGQPYFTMKLVQGHQTLADVISALRSGDPAAHAHYSFERRVRIIQQLCHALHYAHERGVVHRDVKPENVLVGPYGEVYLVDWGVAKVRDVDDEDASGAELVLAKRATETERGLVIGTPAYMAPEQALRKGVDARADVYSLAAVAYELLSLEYYLELADRPSVLNLLVAVANTPPRPAESHVSKANGRVPRILSRVLEKALRKAPEERYQTALELEQALQRWFEGTAPIVCPGTAMQRMLARWINVTDRHPVLVPVVSFVVALLFARWLVVTGWQVVQRLAS